MKKLIKKFIMILSLTQSAYTASYASENSKWAQGPFWKAPQEVQFSRALKSVDSELVNSCIGYKKFITAFRKDEPSEGLAKRIDQIRKLPMSIPLQESFKARFEISNVPFNQIIESEVSNVVESNSSEVLPMFNQSKAVTGINLKNLKSVSINTSEDSFVNFSRSLGLSDSTISIALNRQGQMIIETTGRDVACDLISKKIYLSSLLPSYVRITEDASSEMNAFYNSKLAPVISNVLATAESSTIKAIRLGYRLGKILEETNINNEQDFNVIENQMKNLMSLLFIPKTLSPSSLLLQSNEADKQTIDFSSSVNGSSVMLNLGVE